MNNLPQRTCRHRARDINGELLCHSPLMIAPEQRVTAQICDLHCCYADHEWNDGPPHLQLPARRAATNHEAGDQQSEVEFARVAPDSVCEDAAIEEAKAIRGWMSDLELSFLFQTAASLTPSGSWVEVGSFAGRSLLATGLAMPTGCSLTSVELGRGVPPSAPMSPEIEASRQHVLAQLRVQGINATGLNEGSLEAAQRFADRSLDVVFLDGDHTSAGLEADILAWMPKLKPGGLICGHDYWPTHPGVSEAVDRLLPERSIVARTKIWSYRIPFASPNHSRGMKYLSVAAIYKSETPWLREWVEYHRNRGVEQFLLFNNDDDPVPSERELAPYVAQGLVKIHRMPGVARQYQAIRAACDELRHKVRWMAHIDLDEFILPRQSDSFAEALQPYESYGAVAMNWRLFGTSGLLRRPASQINDLLRCSVPTFFRNYYVKSVVDPALVRGFQDPHFFALANGQITVDENHDQVTNWQNKACPQSVFRINHYSLRSLEDFFVKLLRGRATTAATRNIEYFINHDQNDCFDDEIKRRFGNEVKDRPLHVEHA